MRSLLRSRLVTMLGLRRARSSPRMSRPARSPSPERDRSTKRDTSVTTGTTEVALPGLETQGITAAPASVGHWIERGTEKRLMVFSGGSHPDLAQRIADQLGVQLGEVELGSFANGETY